MKILHMLAWSIRLDFDFLFKVDDIPYLEKTRFILLKYRVFLKNKVFGLARNGSSVFALGGRFYFSEIFGLVSLQRVYCSSWTLKKLLPANPLIVDVGANIGQFNFFGRYYLNARRIVSIEPVKVCCELLKLNATAPNDCICCAVSDVEGDVLFHVAQESSQLSSYLKDDKVSYEKSYRVPARRLDTIVAEMNIDRIDLLKIDTEGSEFDVLKSADELLSRIDMIVVEMSVFRKSSGNLFKIGNLLEKKGFTLVELSSGVSKNPRDIDAVFKRL